MHYIYTNNAQQQKQLQLQFNSKNNYYLVPNKHSYFVAEMLSSICFEFFQNNIPKVVQKIKEMLTSSFNSSYSLTTFREILSLVKKQKEEVRLFKDYLVEMNTAFAESPNEIDIQNEENESSYCDLLFTQSLQGQSHFMQNLDQCQLPIYSQLLIKCDSDEAKTQKTMQSDLCYSKIDEITPLRLAGNGTEKLLNFFNQSTFNKDQWKTDRKSLEGQANKSGSKQMSSFRKKGSTILDSNKDLSQTFIKQMQYDLTRQMNLAKNAQQKKHMQIQKYNYQKKIKDALVNYKLKLRKRK